MKKLLYLVLSLIALALIYLRLNYGEASQQLPVASPTSQTNSATPESSPRIDLSEKLDNDYFTLAYDKSATTSSYRSPDSQEWVISYMGEDQKKSGRMQTELWDGYSLTITRFETVGNKPDQKQAEADRSSIIDACGEENSTPIKPGKVGNYETITFYGGCLGEGDYHYLMMANTLYRLTIMTLGSEQLKPHYQAVVGAMLNSLSFK
ncbi:MAG: hypothetical protein Fur0011_6330 [Candidatus Microgenomates bacterium]